MVERRMAANIPKEATQLSQLPPPGTKFEVDADDIRLLRHRPRMAGVTKYPPPKTTIAAGAMLITGIVLLIAGLVVWFGDNGDSERGLPMLVLGAIVFIPGSYASIVIFGAWRGWRGYDYGQIPSYDEE